MAVKELNIKNRTYYFYNDLINALIFESNNLEKHGKALIFIILVMLIKINQKISV